MISILIPIYNRGHLITETLESIKQQTYSDWECIIVDDGSTDNSISVIQQFINNDKRFILLNRPDYLKKGPSSCRNFAFEKSKGKFIQFFDSDDIMHPNHLQEKIENISNNDFIICKLREFSGEFSEEGSFREEYPDIVKTDSIFESFVTGEFYMLMMVAPLWNKEAISSFMPMREDLHILEDHEFYARILFDKNKYEIINKELIYYRVGLPSLLNEFYSNVNYGLDSYFEAKKTVLILSNSPKIKFSILKTTLSLFRMALAQKQFDSAKKCLYFCRKQNLAYSLNLKLKIIKIHFIFLFVLITKRGDTYFKSSLKI